MSDTALLTQVCEALDAECGCPDRWPGLLVRDCPTCLPKRISQWIKDGKVS